MIQPKRKPWVVVLILLVLTICACRSGGERKTSGFPPIRSTYLPAPTVRFEISHLSNCTDANDRLIQLNADAPVIILVHGCTGSAGDFYTLADIFAFHGQQAVCFTYNDRASIWVSTDQLVMAITDLATHLNHPDITLIGHSQGGLIARKALVETGKIQATWQPQVRFRLVTIAAPFAGIEAARHCGSKTLAILSMGLTIPICRMISGDKWHEITFASDFIGQPGMLVHAVNRYLKIDTDERDSCRRFDGHGSCREDDFVFSLAEQYHKDIDADHLVDRVELKVGHVEIIGDVAKAPVKLIAILQAEGIMAPTPPGDRSKLAWLLWERYHRP